MQLSNVLNILLGAALVAVGVLVAALAERIRGARAAREVPLRASRVQAPATTRAAVIPVVEPAPARAQKPSAPAGGGEDVIAALVAAGYKKPTATEAAWACGDAERETIEGWTAAALRRCVRGGAS
jgi:hypothetical protein